MNITREQRRRKRQRERFIGLISAIITVIIFISISVTWVKGIDKYIDEEGSSLPNAWSEEYENVF